MRPIDPGGDHGELVVMAKDQPEYAQLPARVSADRVFVTTRWQLDEEDTAAIEAGGDILLRLMTFGHPLQPIMIAVGGLEERPYEPVYTQGQVDQLLAAMRDMVRANPDEKIAPVFDAGGTIVGLELAVAPAS